LEFEGFEFDVTRYHVGLNPDKEFRFDPRLEDQVRSVPIEVWKRVEQLYIIGMVTSFKHLQATIANLTPHNIPENVLKYYLTKHVVRMGERRRMYLKDMEALTGDETELRPEQVREKRLQVGMSILIEGYLMKALHGDILLSTQDLARLAKMVKEYTGMDLTSKPSWTTTPCWVRKRTRSRTSSRSGHGGC
jgi:hypothetical protein